METLSFEQMENIDGGRSARKNLECALGIAGFAAATVGLFTLTAASGGLAIGAALIGYSIAPSAAALACF